MNTVDKYALTVRYVAIIVFIIFSIVCYITFSKEEKEDLVETVLSFWPPDMVPHGPHIPPPKDGPRDPAILS